MARTRRRPSYRKSKRWNPPKSRRGSRRKSSRRASSSRGRRGRNPGGVYHRSLRDGSKITVTDSGSVTVHDEGGREYDSYHIKPYEVSRFLKDLGHGRHANKGHYRYDDMHGEYQTMSRNPKRGRGRKGRGRSRSGLSRRNCGGSRRNPAQFPMPFVSAMNPRRGRGRRRGRRNPPIRRKDARAMKRVLRIHHYRCR